MSNNNASTSSDTSDREKRKLKSRLVSFFGLDKLQNICLRCTLWIMTKCSNIVRRKKKYRRTDENDTNSSLSEQENNCCVARLVKCFFFCKNGI